MLNPNDFQKSRVLNKESITNGLNTEGFQLQGVSALPNSEALIIPISAINLASNYFRPQLVFTEPTTKPKHDSELAYINKRVVCGIEFAEGSYFVDGDTSKKVTYPRFIHPGVIISVSRSKSSVVTKCVGTSRNIIQDLGLNPYHITIRGVLINSDGKTLPYRQAKTLIDIYEAPGSMDIISEYLDRIYGVKTVYMNNIEFNLQEGDQNAIYFTIDCISDEPIELLIKEK